MDLEGDCSSPETTENREETSEKLTQLDEIKLGNNGYSVHDSGDLRSSPQVGIKPSGELNGKEIGIGQPMETPPKTMESTPAMSGGSSPTTKGYGLKKWKRIRRECLKDGGSSIDLNRILKRGLSNAAEPTKSQDPSIQTKQKSEGSASVNLSVKNPVVSFDNVEGSSSESRFAIGSTYPVDTDSENSEDQSSRSSTAASVPKLNYDMLMLSGSARDKVKSPSGRSSSNVIQRVQLGKGRFETTNKSREERVKIETEKYSSMESYLGNSNIVFTQGGSSVIGSGRQSERSTNYDGENSDEAQASRPESSEEIQIGWSKQNGGGIEDVSQNDVAADTSWEVKEEESEHQRSAANQNLLAKSIISLQAVQEALVKEVHKFREIETESFALPDELVQGLRFPAEITAVNPAIYEPCPFDQMHVEGIGESGPVSVEAQLINLNQKVKHVERKLEYSEAMLKAKESRIVELKTALNSSEPMKKEESGSTIQAAEGKCREMEKEDLFKQKVEAEVEYLVITTTTQKMKVVAEDRIALFAEQKTLVGEATQLLHKLREAESKAVVMKRRAEELEASCEVMLGNEMVLKMQNEASQFSLCFFMQLVLLLIAFGMFVFRIMPHPVGFVPT